MASPSLTKIAYQTLQQGKSLAGLAHKGLSSKIMELILKDELINEFPLSNELIRELRFSMTKLQEEDWKDAEDGIYPKDLLFEVPWLEWARKYPLIWLDMPKTWIRRKRNKTRDIPKKINKDLYPDYYLQNFHHQTDGYLSDHSASLYDIQVEILFNGTADSMRRRVLCPIKNGIKHLQDRNLSQIRILDVATGTGRTLQQIRRAFPEAELFGLDLSGAYLKQASKYLSAREGEMVQLVRGNAEKMPFDENSMHAITCVFLLHELPRVARQNVINECYKIIEPGGSFVLADSIQLNDSPNFMPILENFHKTFHEPYYRDYIKDNIEERLYSAGFKDIKSDSHFMTKLWSAKKPID
tara:strand:- start:267 stop:1331 length:1065 start_codon:yes stop_codon:yes gene_type:complete